MSIAGAESTRLIQVTAGNIRNSHVYITGHHDFFPSECFGQPRRSANGNGHHIHIHLDGLDRVVDTDIGKDAKTGEPRREFRGRKWVREFFQWHGTKPGDVLELRRCGPNSYRLKPLTSSPTFRMVEFFAGIGLVRLALADHFKVVFANDIDPAKLRMYGDNFETDHFSLGDIRKLSGDDIPDCQLVTASFPCTDLSIAGAMNGIHSGESSAFWGLVTLLTEMGRRLPPLVLLENVPGFLMSHGGNDLAAALAALNGLGYATDAFFLDAARFVPQSRLRLFIVGRLGGVGGSTFGCQASVLRTGTLANFIQSHGEINWSIRELPEPPRRALTLPEIIEDVPHDDPAWWNPDRKAYFLNQLSDRHMAVAKRMLAGTRLTYATAFRRVRKGRSMAELRTDGLAGCLRTPRGGSGRQILFAAGKGRCQVRLLTARECARLQGVPETYKINVPLNQALFGFGDAVCVPAVKWIADNYLLPCLAHPTPAETR